MESSDAPPPTRHHMDDPNIRWRDGVPDYTVVNAKYMKERKMKHQAGSLEKIVEDLVKTFEMESMHKEDIKVSPKFISFSIFYDSFLINIDSSLCKVHT